MPNPKSDRSQAALNHPSFSPEVTLPVKNREEEEVSLHLSRHPTSKVLLHVVKISVAVWLLEFAVLL
jgi:hypothetical protein